MANNRFLKQKSCVLVLIAIIVSLSFFRHLGVASVSFDQDTLSPDSARVVNIPDCPKDYVLDVTYQVLSGPGIDAYLVEGFITLLFNPPSSYILFDDDSNSNHWTYSIPSEGNYAVIFLNDKEQDIEISYNVDLRTSNPFGTLETGPLLLIFMVSTVIAIVIIIVAIYLVLRANKAKRKIEIEV